MFSLFAQRHHGRMILPRHLKEFFKWFSMFSIDMIAYSRLITICEVDVEHWLHRDRLICERIYVSVCVHLFLYLCQINIRFERYHRIDIELSKQTVAMRLRRMKVESTNYRNLPIRKASTSQRPSSFRRKCSAIQQLQLRKTISKRYASHLQVS